MTMLQDLRHAIRVLRRERGYAVVALLAIALGVGATTTLFSVTYGVLLKPLPWPDPDRLVRLEERRGGRSGRVPWTITNGTYLAWTGSSTVDAIGGWMSVTSTFTDGGEPERIRLGRLTPTVFTVLDARAFIGRVFDAKDAAGGRVDTVILSHGFWLRRFGGAPDIIGRPVRLDDLAYTVVGVMPARFAFPDRETQAWIPAHIAPVYSDNGDAHFAADLRCPCADASRGHAGAGRRRRHRAGLEPHGIRARPRSRCSAAASRPRSPPPRLSTRPSPRYVRRFGSCSPVFCCSSAPPSPASPPCNSPARQAAAAR